MLRENRFAFKEWAAVCAALAAGRQSLILRKGGLHEGVAGFRVEHREFWLFPTQFHQSADQFAADGWPFLEAALRDQAGDPNEVRLQWYAVVDAVYELRTETELTRLPGLHIWSERTVHDRFHYKSPGLFGLAVRVYRRPTPWRLPASPHFGQCRSWVDLPSELATDGLESVLDDDAHARQLARIQRALGPAQLA